MAEKTYVAFLRGINMGGHAVIKKDELQGAFRSLGFRDVKTVLASGNVLFKAPHEDTAAMARAVSSKLKELVGHEVATIVRPLDDLRELEARQPFKGVEAGPRARYIVTFYPGRHDVASLPTHEGFRVLSASGGIICSVLYDRTSVGTPVLMGAIEKELGRSVTTRTWDTLLKVLKAGGAG